MYYLHKKYWYYVNNNLITYVLLLLSREVANLEYLSGQQEEEDLKSRCLGMEKRASKLVEDY